MLKRRDETKGKFIVIDDCKMGDSVIIKQGDHAIVFESNFPAHEIEIKCIREGETLEKKGLMLSYELLEAGLENYEYIGKRRILKNPPEGGPMIVIDWTLRYKGK